PGAVPNAAGADNLVPLGEAGNIARVQLQAWGRAWPGGQGTVAVPSLGLLDLVQSAAVGLTPGSQYQVYFTESDRAPYGKREPVGVEDQFRGGRNRTGYRSVEASRPWLRHLRGCVFALIPHRYR